MLIARTAARARWGEKAEEPEQALPGNRVGGFQKGDCRTLGEIQTRSVPASSPAKEAESTAETIPFSMFKGTVKIGDLDIECHVLSDEMARVHAA